MSSYDLRMRRSVQKMSKSSQSRRNRTCRCAEAGWKMYLEEVKKEKEKKKERLVPEPLSWGCLGSKRTWGGEQRADWQGLVGVVKKSWVFPMKMANHEDTLISGTEEQNWKLFVCVPVLGDLGRLLPHSCPSAHSERDIQQGNIHFDKPRQSLTVAAFINAMEFFSTFWLVEARHSNHATGINFLDKTHG